MSNELFFEDDHRLVVPLRADYPAGHIIPPHCHRRDQLLYGTCGVVIVTTPTGTWVMPPQRGMWIPANIHHHVSTPNAVRTNSLYFEPGLIVGMPERCQVVGISEFMRGLLGEAMELPKDYEQNERAKALMTLIRYEVRQLPHLPLSLPFPRHRALAARCNKFLLNPTVHSTIDQWSGELGLNRRSFTRLFRRETGLTFMAWRQQTCILVALQHLAAGVPITTIAIGLGYDNPAAFTSMFKRSLGAPPHLYLNQKHLSFSNSD